MRIQIKKDGVFGYKKMDSPVKIDDVVFHEDFINPDQKHVALYFRGHDSSGIMRLSYKEAEDLMKTMKDKLKIVKKMKVFKE